MTRRIARIALLLLVALGAAASGPACERKPRQKARIESSPRKADPARPPAKKKHAGHEHPHGAHPHEPHAHHHHPHPHPHLDGADGHHHPY